MIITLFILAMAGFIYFRCYKGLPSQSGAERSLLKEIKKRGEIIIGTDATYPPMESVDAEGNLEGVDMDIGKEIAADLGVKPVFKNISWDEIFNALRDGEIDVIISSVTITPQRAESMSFSDPYFNAGQVIVIKSENQDVIKGVEDLGNRILGVQTGTTSEEQAKSIVDSPSEPRGYENYNLAKKALLDGEIDAIIVDYPAAVGLVSSEENLQIAGEPFTQEFYGVVVRKDETSLLAEINKTIRRLKKEGTLRDLEIKWLANQ